MIKFLTVFVAAVLFVLPARSIAASSTLNPPVLIQSDGVAEEKVAQHYIEAQGWCNSCARGEAGADRDLLRAGCTRRLLGAGEGPAVGYSRLFVVAGLVVAALRGFAAVIAELRQLVVECA